MLEVSEFELLSGDVGTFEVLVLAPSEHAVQVVREVKPVVNLNFGPIIPVIELVCLDGRVAVQVFACLVPVGKVDGAVADDALS